MTENNQTQDNQADLNKSQQPEAGADKQAQGDQTLNQAKTAEEEKTFQEGQANQTQDQAGQQQPGQYAKDDQAETEVETETDIDDEEEDTQSETSNT